MSGKYICINCMEEIDQGGQVCPLCGYSAASYHAKNNVLPLMTILAGRYLVGRVLGQGGFGITYVARDLKLEKKVCIKEFYMSGTMYRENSVSQVVSVSVQNEDQETFYKINFEKFEMEAKVLAKLDKVPGIVSVSDYFRENNTAYIVLEFLEGTTLKNYVKQQGGKLPWKEVVTRLTPVLHSLHILHDKQILHRDISPDNIMVGTGGEMVLFDFGGAKLQGNNGGKSMVAFRKAGYSPVEQYGTTNQGPWTDVYAISATMYYCITGKVPPEAVERIQAPDPLVRISDRNIEIPEAVERVIYKGMAVDRSQRYQSIAQLENDLEAAIQGRASGEAGGFGAEVKSGSSGAEDKSGSAGAEDKSGSAGAEGKSGGSGGEVKSDSSGAEVKPGSSGAEAGSTSTGTETKSGSSGAESKSGSSGETVKSDSTGTAGVSQGSASDAKDSGTGSYTSTGWAFNPPSAKTENKKSGGGIKAFLVLVILGAVGFLLYQAGVLEKLGISPSQGPSGVSSGASASSGSAAQDSAGQKDSSSDTASGNASSASEQTSASSVSVPEDMEAVVGSTPFDLVITGSGSNNILGMGETNLGDFVADAYRNYFHADVAFVHASTFGFLGLSQGEITNADLYGPLPDENDVCLIEASGQQLLDALEMGARYYPSACMGWIHPSGLTYEVDADQESGVDTDEQNGFAGVHGVYRVRKVLVNGEKLDLSKTYTLALGADYYMYGEEGMTMFTDCPVLAPEDWTRAVSDRTVTAAYLSMIGTVGDEYRNPDGDGRIRIISGGSVVSSGSSQSGNGGTSDSGSTAQLAGDTYVVRKTGLKLCSDQSLGSPVCDLVPGELLCVRDTGSGTAYEVAYGTLTGWVDASGLALLQSGYCGIVEGSSVYVNANAAENTAQLRVKPSADARVGANLPYGQELQVGRLKKEWAKVKCADGTEGWIRLCELGIFVPAYRYVVWYESGIQVRESPGADAKRLGSLSGGDVVDILEVKNGWGKTAANGWVCMRNLAAIAK